MASYVLCQTIPYKGREVRAYYLYTPPQGAIIQAPPEKCEPSMGFELSFIKATSLTGEPIKVNPSNISDIEDLLCESHFTDEDYSNDGDGTFYYND